MLDMVFQLDQIKAASAPVRLLCYWAWLLGFFHSQLQLPRPRNNSRFVRWATTVEVVN